VDARVDLGFLPGFLLETRRPERTAPAANPWHRPSGAGGQGRRPGRYAAACRQRLADPRCRRHRGSGAGDRALAMVSDRVTQGCGKR